MAYSVTSIRVIPFLISKNQAIFSALMKNFHTSEICCKVRAGRYKTTTKRDRPLTYEQSEKPNKIAHRKSFKSWNTSNLLDGLRPAETAVEDIIIRRFVTATWHDLFVSDILVKRRHNMIFIGGIIHQNFLPRRMYFLIGYTEELLSFILKCPVKLELQSVPEKKDVVFKYI